MYILERKEKISLILQEKETCVLRSKVGILMKNSPLGAVMTFDLNSQLNYQLTVKKENIDK